MSLSPYRSLSNSHGTSCSDERWGGPAGAVRLTAVEELRGHFEDCQSLYARRFLFADVSTSHIATVERDVSSNATAESECTAAPPAQPLPPSAHSTGPTAAAASAGEAFSALNGADNVSDARGSEGGLDTSTAAVVLFVSDGAKASSPGSPLGVVVCFHYYLGFVVCAEKHFASVAEAQREARDLANGETSVASLVEGGQGWSRADAVNQLHSDHLDGSDLCEGKRIAATTPHNDNDADERCGGGVDAGGDEDDCVDAYESLMALLVHRYL